MISSQLSRACSLLSLPSPVHKIYPFLALKYTQCSQPCLFPPWVTFYPSNSLKAGVPPLLTSLFKHRIFRDLGWLLYEKHQSFSSCSLSVSTHCLPSKHCSIWSTLSFPHSIHSCCLHLSTALPQWHVSHRSTRASIYIMQNRYKCCLESHSKTVNMWVDIAVADTHFIKRATVLWP